jgi:hypothetical protein
MKTMTQDPSLKLDQLSGFLHQSQSKVIWVDFFSKQRMTKPCTRAVIAANRSCFLLRSRS